MEFIFLLESDGYARSIIFTGKTTIHNMGGSVRTGLALSVNPPIPGSDPADNQASQMARGAPCLAPLHSHVEETSTAISASWTGPGCWIHRHESPARGLPSHPADARYFAPANSMQLPIHG